jgi:hypothetical protein
MIGFGAVCVLSGLWFVAVSIRPHRSSEAGRLTGSSRVFARLGGIGTGGFLIAIAIAAFSRDLNALAVIFGASLVLYIVLVAAAFT